MTSTYIIPSIAKEELQKKLEKLSKKANAYGNHLTWSFGEEFVATRNVYTIDHVSNKKVATGEQKVFAVEVTIDSDIIKKDGYTVVAQIEAVGYEQNLVKMFDESQPELAWYTMPLFCEHCGTRRVKRFSFIVRDESGHYKQVGKTCLKDYCGIDPKIIAMSQELTDEIIEEYGIDEYDFAGSGEFCYDVLRTIAEAYEIVKKYGYVKSEENHSTKSRLMYDTGKIEPSAEAVAFAQKMQEELTKVENRDLSDFLRNVKSLILAKYCRMNAFGYLAYAPVAFEKLMKQREQEQNRNQTKGLGDYIGNVGEKITVDIKESKLITSWETLYGWTHLYKFVTTDDNVLVWYASKGFDGEPIKITGTVKDHKEYDGEKQTVLTRCKITKKPEEIPAELKNTEDIFSAINALYEY